MAVYTVQREGDTKTTPYGPKAERHLMHEDLVGTYVTLERGSRPRLLILDVYEASDGIRCFGRIMTGSARGTTAFFPLDELGPCDYVAPLPHDRWESNA
jgi:hypothetical protein